MGHILEFLTVWQPSKFRCIHEGTSLSQWPSSSWYLLSWDASTHIDTNIWSSLMLSVKHVLLTTNSKQVRGQGGKVKLYLPICTQCSLRILIFWPLRSVHSHSLWSFLYLISSAIVALVSVSSPSSVAFCSLIVAFSWATQGSEPPVTVNGIFGENKNTFRIPGCISNSCCSLYWYMYTYVYILCLYSNILSHHPLPSSSPKPSCLFLHPKIPTQHPKTSQDVYPESSGPKLLQFAFLVLFGIRILGVQACHGSRVRWIQMVGGSNQQTLLKNAVCCWEKEKKQKWWQTDFTRTLAS